MSRRKLPIDPRRARAGEAIAEIVATYILDHGDVKGLAGTDPSRISALAQSLKALDFEEAASIVSNRFRSEMTCCSARDVKTIMLKPYAGAHAQWGLIRCTSTRPNGCCSFRQGDYTTESAAQTVASLWNKAHPEGAVLGRELDNLDPIT